MLLFETVSVSDFGFAQENLCFVFGTMSSDRESSLKLLVFNGKAESWDNWEFGFVCRAVLYRYDHILNGDVICPTDRKSTRLNSSHSTLSRMPSSA